MRVKVRWLRDFECRHCTLVEAETEEHFILRYEGEVEEGR